MLFRSKQDIEITALQQRNTSQAVFGQVILLGHGTGVSRSLGCFWGFVVSFPKRVRESEVQDPQWVATLKGKEERWGYAHQ